MKIAIIANNSTTKVLLHLTVREMRLYICTTKLLLQEFELVQGGCNCEIMLHVLELNVFPTIPNSFCKLLCAHAQGVK